MPHYIDLEDGNALNVDKLLVRIFVRARNDEDYLLTYEHGERLSKECIDKLYTKYPSIKEMVVLLQDAQQGHITVYDKMLELATVLASPNCDAKSCIDDFKQHFRTLTDDEQKTIGKYKDGAHATSILGIFEPHLTLNSALDGCKNGTLTPERASGSIRKIANNFFNDLDDTEFLKVVPFNAAEKLANELKAEWDLAREVRHGYQG